MDELREEVSVLHKSVIEWCSIPHTQRRITNDSAVGHPDDKHYRESAFGSVYTHSHTPVTSMTPEPPPKVHISDPHANMSDLHERSDQYHSKGGHRRFHSDNLMSSQLPKLSFPNFDGSNPQIVD